MARSCGFLPACRTRPRHSRIRSSSTCLARFVRNGSEQPLRRQKSDVRSQKNNEGFTSFYHRPAAHVGRSPERVFVPGNPHPVVMKQTSDEVHLLTRLRDEAHRFAITFHRKLRGKRTLKSALDDIPGVGPARRRALLSAFGSVKAIRGATASQIGAVPGIGPELARAVADHLRNK